MLTAIDISTEPAVREDGPVCCPAGARTGALSRDVLIACAAAKLADAARRIAELEAKIAALSVQPRSVLGA